MKILVTGGSGFIGTNFIKYWLQGHPNDSIVNIDLLTYAGDSQNIHPLDFGKRYKLINENICDPYAVQFAMRGVDMVVHFAAESHVDRSIMYPSKFVTTNVLGTQVLLEEARRHKIKRFHHVSTDEVFGTATKKFTEKTLYNPSTPYAASKAASDQLVKAYYKTYGLPVSISNCGNNYGPYQMPEKFIPKVIMQVITGKHITIHGDGSHKRDWIYVFDHCSAIEKIIQSEETIGESFCVGGDTNITNLKVAHLIAGFFHTKKPKIKYIKDREANDPVYALDHTKLTKYAEWQPMYKFEDALSSTIRWYMHHHSWSEKHL